MQQRLRAWWNGDRMTPARYSWITGVALGALMLIVVTGAGVRLTGSGLGCTDWPRCNEQVFFARSGYHELVEQINRWFTGLIIAIVAIGVLGSLIRKPRRRDLTWLSISLVVGVFAQAILGGITVLVGLKPQFVMAHFLLSMVVVGAAAVLHRRARQPDGQPKAIVHRDYLWLGRTILVLTAVVLFVGTMVTGTGPHAGAEDVPRLGFTPHVITKIHGAFVWLLIAVVAVTVWRLHATKANANLVKWGEGLMGALLVQGAIGYFQYALGVPAGLVIFHIVGATAVFYVALRFYMAMFERWGVIDFPVYDGDGMPDPQAFAAFNAGESAPTGSVTT